MVSGEFDGNILHSLFTCGEFGPATVICFMAEVGISTESGLWFLWMGEVGEAESPLERRRWAPALRRLSRNSAEKLSALLLGTPEH